MKRYTWQAVAYSRSLHNVQCLHLTNKTIVTRALIQGSRHTYLACLSLGIIEAVRGREPFRASVPGNLYRAIVVTRVFSFLCVTAEEK